jgi:hypothetical protein
LAVACEMARGEFHKNGAESREKEAAVVKGTDNLMEREFNEVPRLSPREKTDAPRFDSSELPTAAAFPREHLMFNAAKDLLTSKAARSYLNNLIARYGKVQELTIDSRNRRVRLVALLDGEVDAVTVDIDSYQIHSVGDKRLIEMQSCRCSRRWLETLLIDRARGQRFELPGWAAAAL